jgi:hypothetical protein
VVINAVTHGVPDDVVIEEPDRLGLPSFGTTSKWVFQKSDASCRARLGDATLVLRFRRSHHIAAPSIANVGIKGALENL